MDSSILTPCGCDCHANATDLKRLIDADEHQINQWAHDAQIYAETYARAHSTHLRALAV